MESRRKFASCCSRPAAPQTVLLRVLLLALLHAHLGATQQYCSGWSMQREDRRGDRDTLLRDEALRRLSELGAVSDSPNFLERTCLSPASRRAAQLVAGWMRDAGLETWIDAIGNVHGRTNGGNASAPALLLGSHLDTVVDAGRFDGALGIICAIAAVKAFSEDEKIQKYPRPIEIIAFSDEEGVRFQSTFLGSAAIAGTFKPELLNATDKQGVKLREALVSAALPGTEDSISRLKYDADAVWGYIEVHIEQGPVLEASGLPLGVVEAISGQTRLSVEVKGTQGHAGTVPMRMRRDPMPAAAQGIVAIEEICEKADRLDDVSPDEQTSRSLVCTVGEITTWPGASNVIPGEVVFTVDIRAKDDIVREVAVFDIERTIQEICKDRAVSCEVERKHEAGSIKSSLDLMKRLQAGGSLALQEIPAFRRTWLEGETVKVSLPLLSSGAGHDAMALASVTQVGMLFVRCVGGISHSPAENVVGDDVWAASTALYLFLDADIRGQYS